MNYSNLKFAALLAMIVPVFCFGWLDQARYQTAVARAQTMSGTLKGMADYSIQHIEQLNREVNALERIMPLATSYDRADLQNVLREKQDELNQALWSLEKLESDYQQQVTTGIHYR